MLGGRSQRDRDQQFQGQGGGSVAQRPFGEHPHRDHFDAVESGERNGNVSVFSYQNGLIWAVYGIYEQ